jgi:predicted nucleotidyltransferase
VTKQEYISLVYHDLFSYILSKDELKRWVGGKKFRLEKLVKIQNLKTAISPQQKRNRIASEKKLVIAQHAATLLEKIPFVLFVGITGSLAMNNAKPESDIDFMVITRNDSLWITRILSLLTLSIHHSRIRRARNRDEKDKLCLNLWIDEGALHLPDMPRSAYTAHEVAQVIPLVNKNKTYEKWLQKNKWVADYWPHAVTIPSPNMNFTKKSTLLSIVNTFAFFIQRLYMGRKITRETVTLHTAYFHPFDWGEKILKELKKKGVIERVI